MPSRPRRPWRVTLHGDDRPVESEHTSERAAYTFLLAALRGDGPAHTAGVAQWVDGRWFHFETVRRDDLPPAS